MGSCILPSGVWVISLSPSAARDFLRINRPAPLLWKQAPDFNVGEWEGTSARIEMMRKPLSDANWYPIARW
jgi:hypothetical protein